MTLYKECLEALKEYTIIEDKELEKKLFSKLKLTFTGKVDFTKYINPRTISFDEIPSFLGGKDCYIIWDNAEYPILKADIDNIMYEDNIYEVLAVGFNTWFISADMTRIIEYYHENELTAAYTNP